MQNKHSLVMIALIILTAATTLNAGERIRLPLRRKLAMRIFYKQLKHPKYLGRADKAPNWRSVEPQPQPTAEQIYYQRGIGRGQGIGRADRAKSWRTT